MFLGFCTGMLVFGQQCAEISQPRIRSQPALYVTRFEPS
jgi:hypothetical protein